MTVVGPRFRVRPSPIRRQAGRRGLIQIKPDSMPGRPVFADASEAMCRAGGRLNLSLVADGVLTPLIHATFSGVVPLELTRCHTL